MSEEKVNDRQMVYLKDICSQEYYEFKEEERKQVLINISMEGCRGESWALLGDVAFELRLLLEIIANARQYETGKCVLAQIGMMRKKKRILPHVFYIGSTNMLFERMSVLEYLKMINIKEKKNAFVLEKELLQGLLDAGLGYISLSMIGDLSAQERAMFTLYTALFIDSSIIIMNLARLPFDEKEIKCLAYISKKLRSQDKIFLFSTMYPNVAQACSSHLLAIYDNHSIYHGKTQDFVNAYDYQILHFEDEHLDVIQDIITLKFRNCECVRNGNCLDIFCREHRDWHRDQIVGVLHQYQQIPKVMVQSEPSLENAWKERKKVYDE